MKDNVTCKYCGKEYPYRKGKMYCSASCKTMAFRDKQNGVSVIGEMPGEKYNTERKVFFLSDYEAWERKKYNPFSIFCFVIKGQPETDDPALLGDIATAICNDENFERAIEDNSHPICKEYKKFQELFFSNKYLIKKSRPTENEGELSTIS